MVSRWYSRDAHLVTKRPGEVKAEQPWGPAVKRCFYPSTRVVLSQGRSLVSEEGEGTWDREPGFPVAVPGR